MGDGALLGCFVAMLFVTIQSIIMAIICPEPSLIFLCVLYCIGFVMILILTLAIIIKPDIVFE